MDSSCPSYGIEKIVEDTFKENPELYAVELAREILYRNTKKSREEIRDRNSPKYKQLITDLELIYGELRNSEYKDGKNVNHEITLLERAYDEGLRKKDIDEKVKELINSVYKDIQNMAEGVIEQERRYFESLAGSR